MPTVQELGIHTEKLPPRLVGGGAVRVAILNGDGHLRGPSYCAGGEWKVIAVFRVDEQEVRSVTIECGYCQAHVEVEGMMIVKGFT